ncbi:MAG: hypothetical protein WCX65_11355 [bacterium]
MKNALLSCFLGALILVFSAVTTQATPMKDSDVDFSGLAQFIYSWDQDNGDDQLDITRLQVNLSAKPADKVRVFATFDFSGNGSSVLSGAPIPGARYSLMDGTADGNVVDAYADLSYIKNVTFRVGQFPLPISYELNTAPYDLETVQYNQGVGMFGIRDRGIIIFGDPSPKVSVSGWLVNGAGAISGATNDTNDKNDYGLQLDLFPVDFFSVKLWGTWSDQTETEAHGAGLDYAERGLHLFGEFNQANETNCGVFGGFIVDCDYRQWYVNASQRIPHTEVQAVARYDFFKFTIPAGSATRKITTFGFNWDFEKNAKLQVMKNFLKGDNDSLDVQLSTRF